MKRNDVHDLLLLIVVLGVLFLVLMSSPAHCQVQHQTPPAPLSVRYVDNQYPNASDSNDGKTEQTPWLTIEHAMATIAAGTTCYVKAGDYYPSTQGAYVELLHSGSPGSWVTLAAYPGDKGFVVVHGRGLLAEQRSYLEFRGLRVVDTPDKGILVLGPGVDGIRVLGCETYDTFSSGISVQGVRYPADPGDYDNVRDVLISGNDVRLATHGGADECITIAWGVSGLSVVGNIVADGELYESPRLGDEGIDLKEGVRDAVVEGNLLFNLGHNAIYLEAGRGSPSFPAGPDPVLGDILVTRNVVHDTRSNGISVTTEGRGVVDGVTITNNLVFRTEHNGVILYDQSGGGTIQNVSVVNNTTAYCGGDPNEYLVGEYEFGGGVRIDQGPASAISSVLVRNNIAWGCYEYDVRLETTAGLVSDHNVGRDADLQQDPLFANPAGGLFFLQAASPAIDYGSSTGAPSVDLWETTRPQGGGHDAGCYEQ